jgi:sensor domain CHASE-containing protein
MDGQMRALERFALQWERRGEMPRNEWEEAAARLVADFGTIQAIEWVDGDLKVRWIVPLAGNEPALDLDLGFEERRRAALELARDRHEVIVSKPVQLVQGGQGFLVYVPLYPAGVFDGFVLGVYRAEATLAAILHTRATGYELAVREDDELLYGRRLADAPRYRQFTGVTRVRNRVWNVEMSPGPRVMAAHLTLLPWLLFGGGVLLACCAAAATYLARAGLPRSNVAGKSSASSRWSSMPSPTMSGARDNMPTVSNRPSSHRSSPASRGDRISTTATIPSAGSTRCTKTTASASAPSTMRS